MTYWKVISSTAQVRPKHEKRSFGNCRVSKQVFRASHTKAPTVRAVSVREWAWSQQTGRSGRYSNRDKCVCNYCRKEFTCPTSSRTTNLKNHMKSCKEFKAWEDGQDPRKNQKVINHEGKLQNARVSEGVFREAANEMLVIGELPLAFVESLAFKQLCNKVNLYKPHSRKTATRDIVKIYVDKKAALRQWFQTTKKRVSLTILFGFLK